jgi:tetratricopeptide (TPR) repeat protein
MEETQTPGGPRKLLVLPGQPPRLECASRSIRNPGIWFHYLYSQVRSHSPGGNGSTSSFPDVANVPGPNVFLRTRHLGWPNGRRFYASSLVPIIAVLIFCSIGCRHRRASLERRYTEARLLFQQGYIDQPLPLSESGYRDSINYPDLNWKFRVLAAEALTRKGQYDASLELLKSEPPSNIPTELFWRRRLAQASALCQSGKYPQAEERFAQAAAVQAEPGALNYVRGRCAMKHGEWQNAENYLRLVTAQSSNPDPFLKAYALGTLSWLTMRDSRYEETIGLTNECLLIARPLHALPLEQLALGNMGNVYVDLGDFNNARQASEAAEKIAAQLNLLHDRQKWLMNIGIAQAIQGQSGMAEQSYKHALAIATELKDIDVTAACLHHLTTLKVGQHQLDLAEKYHLQEWKLGLKQDRLMGWQSDDADIAAAHGNYDKAIIILRELLQQQEADDARDHLFHFKQIWWIQSRLAKDYALQDNPAEAEKWFGRCNPASPAITSYKGTQSKLTNGSSAASPPWMLALKR